MEKAEGAVFVLCSFPNGGASSPADGWRGGWVRLPKYEGASAEIDAGSLPISQSLFLSLIFLQSVMRLGCSGNKCALTRRPPQSDTFEASARSSSPAASGAPPSPFPRSGHPPSSLAPFALIRFLFLSAFSSALSCQVSAELKQEEAPADPRAMASPNLGWNGDIATVSYLADHLQQVTPIRTPAC